MTLKEKYLQDHPDLRPYRFQGSMNCPDKNGYEYRSPCLVVDTCKECWAREYRGYKGKKKSRSRRKAKIGTEQK